MSVLGAALIPLTGCGEPPHDTAGHGPSHEEVCERFIALLGEGGFAVEHRNGEQVSPPQAHQHRELARQTLDFARWAQSAQDDDLARTAGTIEAQATHVLDTLPPDATDAQAQQTTEALYAQTTKIYAACTAEAYRRVLEGEIDLTGACAEPDAPTLEGPNVIVYPSTQDFQDSSCDLVQGQPRQDGCSFPPRSHTSTPSESAHATIEAAYNPDTCEVLYETGPLHKPTSPP